MTTPHDDDIEPRDAWLRSALKHAPDAHAQPPAALSDAILKQARAAVAPARSSWRVMLRGAWAALARPPVAAAFASLMVATVLGLMWIDRPELEEAASAKIDRPVARPAEAPASTQGPAAPAVEPPVAAMPQAGKEERQERRADPAPRREAAEQPPAAPAAPGVAPAPAPAAAAAGVIADKAEVAQDTEMQLAERSARAAAAEREAQRDGRADAAGAASNEAAKRSRLGAASSAPSPAAQASPARLATWREAIAREPARWQFGFGSGAPRPTTDALQAWLAQLDAASRGRWRASGGSVAGSSETLALWRDGQPAGAISLDAQTVRIDLDARTEQAELDTAEAAALRRAFDELPR